MRRLANGGGEISSSPVVQALVIVPNDPRMFGKIVGESAKHFTVEFFHGVGTRESAELPRDACRHTYLQKQTRVFYRHNENHWRVGRVLDADRKPNGTFEYEIRFANKTELVVPESALYVRALSEYGDPASNLANGCAETQFFADRRQRALGRLLQMRAAAEGLTGLVSASVDFVPHQLAVIRRVLQDPIQRYLLADEVGLGKTIEAGAIIRQTLIDDPTRVILVLAPANMVEQWRHELTAKFHINEFEAECVKICSYEAALTTRGAPDLLVVDEAHEVVAPDGSEKLTPVQSAMARLVVDAARVLLLSATPPVGQEDRLFGLLHLLDPTLYPYTRRANFGEKIQNRGRIGRLLLALQPDGDAFPLRQAANQARKLFAQDVDTVAAADAVLAAGNDEAVMKTAVAALRDQIADTHRIHRRLLRSRRVDAERLSMLRRGPHVDREDDPDLSHVRLDWPNDLAATEAYQTLEDWHAAAQTCAKSRPNLRDVLADRCLDLYEAMGCSPVTLQATLSALDPLFPGEADLLASMASYVADPNSGGRHATIVRMIREWGRALPRATGALPPKIICFASDAQDADQAGRELMKVLGPGAVRRLPFQEDAAKAIQTFAAHREEWVLVCDRLAEEGLNLQFAHGILHADLPLDPTRIEQRIGRLDRYGRKVRTLAHRVFLPHESEDSVWRCWFDLLANGFLIFNQSISDVQFRLDELRSKIRAALFDEGGPGLTKLIGEVRSTLGDERVRLDEQHVFESAVLNDVAPERIAYRMDDEEADEEAFVTDLYPWMTQVIGLEPSPRRPSRGTATRWMRSSNTAVPKFPWLERLAGGLDKPSTWWRQEALRHADQILLRPGAVLIDRLEDFSRWDDRGTAFATWRISVDFREPWLGFQLNWVIEPGTAAARHILKSVDQGGLARRAMALLPPWMTTIYLDEDLHVVEDEKILEILRRPYDDTDINLGSRPKLLASVIDSVRFADLCMAARDSGQKIIQNDPTYRERLENTRLTVEHEIGSQQRALQRRLALARAGEGDEQSLIAEVRILERISQAAQAPRCRLDTLGLFVIGQRPTAATPK